MPWNRAWWRSTGSSMYLRISRERLGLVMMRVDIDDAEILVAPLDRLLAGVGENGRRVEFLGGEIADDDVIRVHSHVSSISPRSEWLQVVPTPVSEPRSAAG